MHARSLWSSLLLLQFVGCGAASGGGGAVAVGVFCVAVCIDPTVHMLCLGRRCPMTHLACTRAACGHRCCCCSLSVAARRAVAAGRWRWECFVWPFALIRQSTCCAWVAGAQ